MIGVELKECTLGPAATVDYYRPVLSYKVFNAIPNKSMLPAGVRAMDVDSGAARRASSAGRDRVHGSSMRNFSKLHRVCINGSGSAVKSRLGCDESQTEQLTTGVLRHQIDISQYVASNSSPPRLADAQSLTVCKDRHNHASYDTFSRIRILLVHLILAAC